MAHATASKSKSAGNMFSRTASSMGKFLLKAAESNTRLKQMRALQELSDADLTKMGLKRDDIPRYVFPGYM